MIKKIKIGIVGCGAIGASLAESLVREFRSQAELSALFDIDPVKSGGLGRRLSRKNLAAGSLKELIGRSDLVIECAKSSVSWEVARSALARKKDIMVMSVGGLIGRGEELRRLAQKNQCRVYIPSGAISGLDALKAARFSKIKKVTLTTTKNPFSFKGVHYLEKRNFRPEGVKKDKLLFFGRAQEAVKYFPQNINVAAVLSLAGVGEKRTMVKIVASPRVKKNIHEVKIESAAGDFLARTENVLHPQNPKTSFLAVLSAIALLKQIFEPLTIGT